MEASTAGVLSFKSISRDILGHISLLLTTLTWITNFYAFQGLLLLEYVVVLKRTEMCVLWWGFTHALPGFVLPVGYPSA